MNDIVAIEEINGIKKNEENAFAFGFVENVKADMLDIRDKFFEIGFRLDEAARLNYCKKLGFSDIGELAEELFDIKKTTAYDLMTIYRFTVKYPIKGKPEMNEKYAKFSQSQILQISRVKWASDDFIRVISPADSVVRISDMRSMWNKIYDCCGTPVTSVNGNQCTGVEEWISLNTALYNRIAGGGKKPKTLQIEPEQKPSVKAEEPLATETEEQPVNKPEAEANIAGPITEKQRQSADNGHIVAYTAEEKRDIAPIKSAKKAEDNEKYPTASEWEAVIKYALLGGELHDLAIGSQGLALTISARLKACIKGNKTELKKKLVAALNDELKDFDYEIKLCGNKQGLRVFLGVVSGLILNEAIK